MRVVHESPLATLAGIVEPDAGRATEARDKYQCQVFERLEDLAGQADAAILATPTDTHAALGCKLLELGLDILIEKPIAVTPEEGRRLIDTAAHAGRTLAVGHLERFNPAILALQQSLTVPLFFEIHRMSEFSPRSLEVDVVLDLMIHDLDVVLTLCGAMPEEIRAAGVSILSAKVDLANVRLAFPGGCIANLTASRVSTERIRKLRLFQPHQYISLDYARQDGAVFSVNPGGGIGFAPLAVVKDEPLRLELEDFFQSVRDRRRPPRVGGAAALAALEVANRILEKIEEHGRQVAATLAEATGHPPMTS